MLFNELVILLSMTGLCYYQLSMEIVQENVPLISGKDCALDALSTISGLREICSSR